MRNPPSSHWLNHLLIAVWVISILVSSSRAYAQPVVNVEPSARFFIQNIGQFETSARFLLESSQSRLWLADDGMWLTWFQPQIENQAGQTAGEMPAGVNLHIKFIGANLHPQLHAIGPVNTQVNYLIKDKSFSPPAWRSVAYTDLYPGIALIIDSSPMNGSNEFLSWRLEAQSTADLSQVQLQIAGADKVQVTQDQLLLDTSVGKVTLPLVETRLGGPFYSPSFGSHVSKVGDGLFDVLFPLRDSPMPKSIVFQASPIDLVYSTYLGGSAWEAGYGIALGQDGSIYIAGNTVSQDFPTTAGAFDRSVAQVDAFITKLDPTSNHLIFSTILGGAGADGAYGITVAGDQAVVTGDTQSRDFPTTSGAYDTTCGTDGTCNTGTQGPLPDAFLAELSPDGSQLVYSTYLGGRDEDRGYSLALDGQQVYLTGITYSPDFPAAGYKANGDAFVVSFDGSHQLSYARLLGGSDVDAGFAIAVRGGEAYITGETSSLDFPAQSYHAGRDLFLARLSTTGSLVNASLVGGFGDERGNSISLDPSGNVVVIGSTNSPDLPVTSGTYAGNGDALILLANPQMVVSKLVYFGGSGVDEGHGLAIDPTGNLWITGFTRSTNFPITSQAFQSVSRGSGDAFLAVLNLSTSASSQLVNSSYLGGKGQDNGQALVYSKANQVYLTGYTQSTDFPVTSLNLDASLNGIQDVFISNLSVVGTPGPIPTLPSSTPTSVIPTATLLPVTQTATSERAPQATLSPTLLIKTNTAVPVSTQPTASQKPSGTGMTPVPTFQHTPGAATTTLQASISTDQSVGTLSAVETLQPEVLMSQTATPESGLGQNAGSIWLIVPVLLVAIGIVVWLVYRTKRP